MAKNYGGWRTYSGKRTCAVCGKRRAVFAKETCSGIGMARENGRGNRERILTTSNMRKMAYTILMLGCSLAVRSHSQGIIQITFDGPPTIPPEASYSITNYEELGMAFRPLPASPANSPTFSRVGPGFPEDPQNSTGYLRAALTQSLMFNRINNSLFNLVSVDLAEYGTAFQQPITVQFIGYYADGSTVSTSFTTDGIIDGTGPLQDFQNFLFPNKEWSGLRRVDVPGWGWSLDNLVVSVPEPATWSLVVCGAALLGLFRRANSPRAVLRR